MSFIIAYTPTLAFRRLKEGESVVDSMEDLVKLQDRLDCDIYITLPDEYGQRRVYLYDP